MTSPPANVRNIAVMGAVGVGKTTFINLSSGAQLAVGHGHGSKSCTQDVQAAPNFELDSCTINLIDTPGFDDVNRSEVQILKMIASYLENEKAKYNSDVKLHGVIYLHSIDAAPMEGISTRTFALFRKLCGTENLENFSIVTTKWSRVKQKEGENREKELTTISFKTALEKGAKLLRHSDTKESANNLLPELRQWRKNIQIVF